MDLRSERIGGWGSLAQAALTLAAVAADLAVIMAVKRGGPAAATGPALYAAAVAVLSGLAQLAAVRGLRFALRPPTRLARVGAAVGGLGASVLVVAGLLAAYGLTRAPGELLPLVSALTLAGPGLVAAWAVVSAAAAWKAGRLPPWLRVTGAVFGAAAIASVGLPVLRVVALLAGLAWWTGLGVELLRLSRAPPPGLPLTTD